jgi:microcystin-dependent protein
MRSLGILILVATATLADHAAAQNQPYYAETMTTAAGFCPIGWAEMDGQILQIAQHTQLFSLIGTTYGGDGVSTFALPLAKPLFTANGVPLRQCIAVAGIFPSQ